MTKIRTSISALSALLLIVLACTYINPAATTASPRLPAGKITRTLAQSGLASSSVSYVPLVMIPPSLPAGKITRTLTHAVELYTIIGGGHAWPGNDSPGATQTISATQLIWSFFAARPKS